MQALAYIGYFALGLFQLAAIMAGLESEFGLHWIIAFPLALVLGQLPLLGSIAGVIGAMEAWHWEWWQAGGLFFGPLVVIFVLYAIGRATAAATES